MAQVKQVLISGDPASKLALYDLDGNGTLSDTEKMMMKYDTSAPFGQFSIAEVKGIVNDLKYTEKAKKNLSRVIVGLVVLLLIILGANMVLTFVVVDMAKDTETSPDGVTRVKGDKAVAKTGSASAKTQDLTPRDILESTHKNEDFLRSTEYFSWSEEGTGAKASVLLAGFEVIRTAVPETSHKLVTVLLQTTAPFTPVLMLSGLLDENGSLVDDDGFRFHRSRELPDIVVNNMLLVHSDPELLKVQLERNENARKLLGTRGLKFFSFVKDLPPRDTSSGNDSPAVQDTTCSAYNRSYCTCQDYMIGSCPTNESCEHDASGSNRVSCVSTTSMAGGHGNSYDNGYDACNHPFCSYRYN